MTIDRTVGLNIIVSHKSTDMRLKSYFRPSAIYRTGMRYVKVLASYQGEVRRDLKKKATYHLHWAIDGKQTKRILEWFIPLEGVHMEQELAVSRVVETAKDFGVEVHVYRVME